MFWTKQMGPPIKFSDQTILKTRSKTDENKLMVMDKSTHEEFLHQPLQTINKQFKIAVSFLTGYNGIIRVTSKKDKFYLTTSNIMFQPNPLEILSFVDTFLENYIAQGMTFRGKRTEKINNWTMNVNPGYKYVECFKGEV